MKPAVFVGNDPTLTPKILEELDGYFCFASGMIDKIYPFTQWRPNVYILYDSPGKYHTAYRAGLHLSQEYECLFQKGLFRKLPTEFDWPTLTWYHDCNCSGPYTIITDEWCDAPICFRAGPNGIALQIAAQRGFTQMYFVAMGGHGSHFWEEDKTFATRQSLDNRKKEREMIVANAPNLGVDIRICGRKGISSASFEK